MLALPGRIPRHLHTCEDLHRIEDSDDGRLELLHSLFSDLTEAGFVFRWFGKLEARSPQRYYYWFELGRDPDR